MKTRAIFEAGNQECARIILREVQRYGGEESLMVRWARLVLSRSAERTLPAIRRAA